MTMASSFIYGTTAGYSARSTSFYCLAIEPCVSSPSKTVKDEENGFQIQPLLPGARYAVSGLEVYQYLTLYKALRARITGIIV